MQEGPTNNADNALVQKKSMAILLSTYNGEKFISEQIDSLLAQTYQDFHVYINDDCSTDSTLEIAIGYAEAHPEKITVTQNEANSGGAKHNAISLMVRHRADYLMLCDQDDVWMPDKIARTLAKMQELEARLGSSTPLLVHTDLEVVDASLETIQPSFREAMNSNFSKRKLNNLIIQNITTGCTVMYNRALADLITAEPAFLVMHDWWLGIVASAFGHIEAVQAPTILYRQHVENVIGARDVRTFRYKLERLKNYRDVQHAVDTTYRQAASFLAMYADRLTSDQVRLLADYSNIPNRNKLMKWVTICRLGTFKNGIGRKIAQFLFI